MDLAGEAFALLHHPGSAFRYGKLAAGAGQVLEELLTLAHFARQRLVPQTDGDGDSGTQDRPDDHGKVEASMQTERNDREDGGRCHHDGPPESAEQTHVEEEQREDQVRRLHTEPEQRQPLHGQRRNPPPAPTARLRDRPRGPDAGAVGGDEDDRHADHGRSSTGVIADGVHQHHRTQRSDEHVQGR